MHQEWSCRRNRRVLLRAAVALSLPLSLSPLTAWALKEPKTGVDFPDTTVFNGVTYEAVHTATVNTRILGIVTYAAAVGYYLERGRVSPGGNFKDALLADTGGKLMVLGFVRNTPSTALRELFWDSLNAKMRDAGGRENERDIRTVIDGFEDMKRADVMQFVWREGGDIELLVHKMTKAKLNNRALTQALFGLFLS